MIRSVQQAEVYLWQLFFAWCFAACKIVVRLPLQGVVIRPFFLQLTRASLTQIHILLFIVHFVVPLLKRRLFGNLESFERRVRDNPFYVFDSLRVLLIVMIGQHYNYNFLLDLSLIYIFSFKLVFTKNRGI